MISGEVSRRYFLTTGGGCLLIGNAFNRGTGLAAEILKPDREKYQSLALRTHEHYGDIEERIDDPPVDSLTGCIDPETRLGCGLGVTAPDDRDPTELVDPGCEYEGRDDEPRSME